MVCKSCNAWNDDNANFCRKCGGELYKSTLVTSPITGSVTAYSAPTSGIRYYSGIGNAYLQSAAQLVRDSYVSHSDAYHSYPTIAKVYLNKDGTYAIASAVKEVLWSVYIIYRGEHHDNPLPSLLRSVSLFVPPIIVKIDKLSCHYTTWKYYIILFSV